MFFYQNFQKIRGGVQISVFRREKFQKGVVVKSSAKLTIWRRNLRFDRGVYREIIQFMLSWYREISPILPR